MSEQSAEAPFEYSQAWYDETYHKGRCKTETRTFAEVMVQYLPYAERLANILNQIEVPDEPITWLEIGAHLGITASVIMDNYPNAFVYMLEFSMESIKFLTREFPFKDRHVITFRSCDDISPCPLDNHDNLFDFCTCIDVTEHLPDAIYKKMIGEIFRVLKPGGKLILMQGIEPQVEHIHILPEPELIADFQAAGFLYLRTLPDRHHFFKKPEA